MPTVSMSVVLGNLRAIVEVASLYPCRSVLSIADALGLSLVGIAPDLLDLSGSEACDAIEAEILVLSSGWTPARSAA